MMLKTCFNVNNICFNYKRKQTEVLKDLSFSIPKGKFTTIIGPNGSGKSTLFGCLSGELLPSKGEILLYNQRIECIPAKERAQKMAVVHQGTNIINGFTVYEIVSMGRTPYHKLGERDKKNDENTVSKALELIGLRSFKDRKIEELSGGQQQRVWLALAIAQDTEIILLDEPMNNLDVFYQFEMLNVLKKMIATKGITVVAILHDLNQVIKYSDYVITVQKGKILKTGDPLEVLTPNLVKELFSINSQVLTGRYGQVFDFDLGG